MTNINPKKGGGSKHYNNIIVPPGQNSLTVLNASTAGAKVGSTARVIAVQSTGQAVYENYYLTPTGWQLGMVEDPQIELTNKNFLGNQVGDIHTEVIGLNKLNVSLEPKEFFIDSDLTVDFTDGINANYTLFNGANNITLALLDDYKTLLKSSNPPQHTGILSFTNMSVNDILLATQNTDEIYSAGNNKLYVKAGESVILALVFDEPVFGDRKGYKVIADHKLPQVIPPTNSNVVDNADGTLTINQADSTSEKAIRPIGELASAAIAAADSIAYLKGANHKKATIQSIIDLVPKNDFFRSGTGNTLPDGTNDDTENIGRTGLTIFGASANLAEAMVDINGTLKTRADNYANTTAAINLTTAQVNAYSHIHITQTVNDATVSIANPSITNKGQFLRVHNAQASTRNLTLLSKRLLPGTFLDLQWNGSAWATEASDIGGNVIAVGVNLTPAQTFTFDSFIIRAQSGVEPQIATTAGTISVVAMTEQEYPGGSFASAASLGGGTAPFGLTTGFLPLSDNAHVAGERFEMTLIRLDSNRIFKITVWRHGATTGNWSAWASEIGATQSQNLTVSNYATNAAAIADPNLPTGRQYSVTVGGFKQVFIK